MKKSLSKLIHLDQYAFVSEGYIGESVRLISDVLDYTTEKKIPGRGESKGHCIRALSEHYPLVTIRARKMSELKVPISADKRSH